MNYLVHICDVSNVNSQSLTFSPLYLFDTQILCIVKMLGQHFMSFLHLSREILVLIIENPHTQLLLKLKETVERSSPHSVGKAKALRKDMSLRGICSTRSVVSDVRQLCVTLGLLLNLSDLVYPI